MRTIQNYHNVANLVRSHYNLPYHGDSRDFYQNVDKCPFAEKNVTFQSQPSASF